MLGYSYYKLESFIYWVFLSFLAIVDINDGWKNIYMNSPNRRKVCEIET
jgi:hypothetical protein